MLPMIETPAFLWGYVWERESESSEDSTAFVTFGCCFYFSGQWEQPPPRHLISARAGGLQ